MRFLTAFFLTGLLAISLFLPAGRLLASPKIASIEIENGTLAPTEQILQVLPLREGDPFDQAKLEQAISTLKKWGRFQVIDYEKKAVPDGIRLRFILRDGFLVSGIDIYGGYPYLSARLRRMITVHSGDLYDPPKALEQEERLAVFYERKGFEGTSVRLTPVLNGKKRTVDLVYRIRKGIRYRLGRVAVTGNTVFPHNYFVSQLNPTNATVSGGVSRRSGRITRRRAISRPGSV